MQLVEGVHVRIRLGEDLCVEEGHTRLQPVRHAHAVRALQVDRVQVPPDAQCLRLHLLAAGAVAEVEVATEELIRALTRQHHLGVRAGEFGEKVVGDGGADQLGLVRLKVIDDLRQHGEGLLGAEEVLVVVRAEVARHLACSHDVGRVGHADGEGLDLAHVGQLSHQRAHDGGVEAAREQQAVPHVRHEALGHRFLEQRAHVLHPARRQCRRRGAERGREPLRRKVALVAPLAGPEVAGGKDLCVLNLPDEALELRRKQHPPARTPAAVERLDPARVARGEGRAVGAHDDQREHAVEHGRHAGAVELKEGQHRLRVRGRAVHGRRAAELGRLQGGALAELHVVVDLPVVHQRVARRRVQQRLLPAHRVHDRETRVAECEAAAHVAPHLVGSARREQCRQLCTQRMELRGRQGRVE
mmetsp:Transcript_8527/g.21772  ORF Transcript_8527/g.21772 Transcript_8527/m.21772 type:complete len:415 (-) Transcript_8527:77-1321(-)